MMPRFVGTPHWSADTWHLRTPHADWLPACTHHQRPAPNSCACHRPMAGRAKMKSHEKNLMASSGENIFCRKIKSTNILLATRINTYYKILWVPARYSNAFTRKLTDLISRTGWGIFFRLSPRAYNSRYNPVKDNLWSILQSADWQH